MFVGRQITLPQGTHTGAPQPKVSRKNTAVTPLLSGTTSHWNRENLLEEVERWPLQTHLIKCEKQTRFFCP